MSLGKVIFCNTDKPIRRISFLPTKSAWPKFPHRDFNKKNSRTRKREVLFRKDYWKYDFHFNWFPILCSR